MEDQDQRVYPRVNELFPNPVGHGISRDSVNFTILLAMTTIGLGSFNLYTGLTRLRMGTGMGAMVSGVSRHRFLGTILVWTFSGTMVTAYGVYLSLFVWFSAG